MNYNSQVADSSVFQHNKVLDIKYDVFFAGLAKGRIQQLDLIQSIIVQKGLIPYFFIPDKSESKQSQQLSYDNYLEKIMQSRALLDFVTDKNYGLTMRPLEAMFLKEN
ncbi:hypothetical protein SUT503_14430 [Streptococcus parasuis]|nr:hypothetical protein SUT503_14430 [Streptococcus parasuis]